MLNPKISPNLQGFPMLKNPNLDIKGQYECVLSKYPETNAILITTNTILLLDSDPDLMLDEKKFNWFLNCSGFALRINDLSNSQPSSQNQKSIFMTALDLYCRWITKSPIDHLLDQEKKEEYIRIFLVHISQIFLNPSFNLLFKDFKNRMSSIFIDRHPSLSEETWATLIKVLLCGSCDYATSKNGNFTELSLLSFNILLESTFKNESFLIQFDSLIHKLFSFPSFSREVWLVLFVAVYTPIVKHYFKQVCMSPLTKNRRPSKSSKSETSQKDIEKTQVHRLNKHLIFEFIREKINQEFSKECKQEAFYRAIQCWVDTSKKVNFPVHPKWPTDEIKSLFLSWFSIDCEWENQKFHPLFTLIVRGEKEASPDLQEIGENLIVNVLEKTTMDHETSLFWYLPVYAYDFLMDNLSFLDSLELSFQNFAVRFENSRMTSNLSISQHLLYILIRLVQRTKSDDIRNTMTNLAVSSKYKNSMLLMVTSILSMVVIKRGDLFWTQINKCFSNRYSTSIGTLMTKETFSKIILIAGFVPLLLRDAFSSNINLDPFFWDLLETALKKSSNGSQRGLKSAFSASSMNADSSPSLAYSCNQPLQPPSPTWQGNQQQLNQQQQLQSCFDSNQNASSMNWNYEAQSDDFLKSIEKQMILLGLFCLSQGTDLFTSHPENNSRLLNLLSKPKIHPKDFNCSNSVSYQSFSKISSSGSAGAFITPGVPNFFSAVSNLSAGAINSIGSSVMSASNNIGSLGGGILNVAGSANVNCGLVSTVPSSVASFSAAPSASSNCASLIKEESDDFENEDVSELKIFRKMTQLSIFCGGVSYRLDTLNNDMSGYTENFVTKKFILSVIGKSHIVIRHALGINVFRVEDLGGRECYKGGVQPSDEKKLLVSEKPKKLNETEKVEDLYVSPFNDQEDEELLDQFIEVDSFFNNNEAVADNLRFEKPPEKKDVSEAHSMLCDLGFISADSSMNTRHISTGCLGFLEKLDKTPSSSSVDVFIFQLLDDNDHIIISRNKGQKEDEESTPSTNTVNKNRYSSLAYSLTNRGKRTKNLDELMQYLDAANDCCIAKIHYHMPTFDDEREDYFDDTNFATKSDEQTVTGENKSTEKVEDRDSEKVEDKDSEKVGDKDSEKVDDLKNNDVNDTLNEKQGRPLKSDTSQPTSQTGQDQEEDLSFLRRRKQYNRRRGTIHSISPSQANQIGFLLLLNETGMVINPASTELNNFECVIAITPQNTNKSKSEAKSEVESEAKSEVDDNENYIVDFISCENTFFNAPNLKNRHFYIARKNIGWIVSLAAFLFYATPGHTTMSGYTHMRSPSHFTSGYCQRSRQIRDLFDRSESGRNTILVGCLSCGIKQS